MNHNRYLRFASSSPCTSLCLAMTQRWFCFRLFPLVWNHVKPTAKQKWKNTRGAAGSWTVFRRKKKLLQNKLWKREQYQSRPDLLPNHLQRLYLFLASMFTWCLDVFCLFATYHHESITPCHRGIRENAHRPPSSPSLRTRFFWTLTHPETLQTCVSLKTSLWSWSIPTKNASFISFFMIPCKCQNKISFLSAFRNRFKAQGATHTFLATP